MAEENVCYVQHVQTDDPYDRTSSISEGGKTRYPLKDGLVVRFTEKYLNKKDDLMEMALLQSLEFIIDHFTWHDGSLFYTVKEVGKKETMTVGEFDIEPKPYPANQEERGEKTMKLCTNCGKPMQPWEEECRSCGKVVFTADEEVTAPLHFVHKIDGGKMHKEIDEESDTYCLVCELCGTKVMVCPIELQTNHLSPETAQHVAISAK